MEEAATSTLPMTKPHALGGPGISWDVDAANGQAHGGPVLQGFSPTNSPRFHSRITFPISPRMANLHSPRPDSPYNQPDTSWDSLWQHLADLDDELDGAHRP